MRSLGKRIKSRRKALGIRKKDLAYLLDVSPATIKKWETGKREPRLTTAWRLSILLRCSIKWLATGGEDPEQEQGGLHQDITMAGNQSQNNILQKINGKL